MLRSLGNFVSASTLAALVFFIGSTGLSKNAQAQAPTAAEVIFVVDESGSMSGEHAFLPGFVTDLNSRLNAGGVTGNYGLVGFGGGGAGNLGRTFDIGGMLLGSATDFGTAASNLVLSGSFEDGFSAIDFTTNTYPDPVTGVRRTIVLVTDEDRDNGNNMLTDASIVADLNARGINLVSVINGQLTGSMAETALATDGTNAFIQNGTGFTTVPLGSTSGVGSTDADYIQTALSTPNGCVADLNQLRAGGDTATAFAEIFAQCLLFAVTGTPGAPPPTTNNLFLNVYVNSLNVVQDAFDQQVSQVIEIDLGSQVVQQALAKASKNHQIAENLLGVDGLRAFLVINLQTGDYDSFGNNKQFDYSGGGTTFGIDYTMTNALFGAGEKATFGAAFGYHALSNDVSFPIATGASGSLQTDVYTGELYAMVKMPEGYYGRANLQVSFANYDQNRVQGAAAFRGSTNGLGISGDLELGYEFSGIMPPWTSDPRWELSLTPFGSIGVDYRSVDGFQETNGGVMVGDFDQAAIIARLGGRATMTYEMGLDTFFLSTEVAGSFDLIDDDETVLINNGALPNERIEPIDDVQLLYGVTTGMKIGEDGSIFAAYNGALSTNSFGHIFSIGGELPF